MKQHLLYSAPGTWPSHLYLVTITRCRYNFLIHWLLQISALSSTLLFVGEPFNDEEMEEMMSAAVDDKGNIVFKEFIPLMAVEEDFGS